jgi:F420-dependent oxidoreductase-like protein
VTIRFGAHIEPQLGYDYEIAERIALEAEKAGYDSFWCSDHLFLNDKSEKLNCMEAWTLLAALAAKTSKIRLGTLVTCNSYRHPSLLAKIAATIDMISNGRLIFGYGAGWKEIEYKAYGYEFPPIPVRMDQMEEALQIIKLLWTDEKASFKGEYYEIKDAFCAPKPVQKPHPPIMIGGDGEKRTLKAVAKYADYCNLLLITRKLRKSPTEFYALLEHKLEVLKKHCKDVGRDYNEIGKSLFASVWPGVFVTESEEKLDEHINKSSKLFEMSTDEMTEFFTEGAPGAWVGYPEDVIERFQYVIDLGFDYFQVMFPGVGEDYIETSQLFAEKVMKKL